MLGGFRGGAQVFARGAGTEVDLTGGDFVAVDQAAVEAQMISAGYAGA
jgi:hypothetical protein